MYNNSNVSFGVCVYAYMRVMSHEMLVKDEKTWRWSVKIAATWGDGESGTDRSIVARPGSCDISDKEGPLSDAANCR